MTRSCHVYDHDGEHIGSFADWDLAHEWARFQTLMNRLATPLEVEDRGRGVVCRVWADRCESESEVRRGRAAADNDARKMAVACVGAAALSFAAPRQRPPH